MNQCYLVNPETINAYYTHGLLYLSASGQCECAHLVAISEIMPPTSPPEYQVTTCPCTQIGSFPYKVHAWFELAEAPETVTVHTAAGPQKVEVQPFPADLSEDLATPAQLTDQLAENEVIGISPNSWDINRAITDAVNKLQKAYPGEVNATLTETGVVAAGSPIGIAFLYVKMRQTTAKKAAKRR